MRDADAQARVEAEHCTKVFGSGEVAVTAVDGVSFRLAAGELVALIGPSGSGKTTLLSLLGALLTPTSGTVRVGGVDLAELDDARRTAFRASELGFVFQTAALVPFLTAIENVALVGTFAGGSKRTARERAGDLLSDLGLAARLDHRPAELSGGEQQRVAIARALLNDPGVLLADEPTAHLDGERGEQVIDLLAEVVHDGQRAGLVVTHDQRIAAHADRTVRIEDGRLVAP